jgi:hypothetical protein
MTYYTGVYNETKIYPAFTEEELPLIYTGNPYIFSINNNYVTFINTGISVLTGYNTGTEEYEGITGTQEVTVNRANAIINFPYIPVINKNITTGYTVNATSNHSESAIQYISSNSGSIIITGGNILAITGLGTGIISGYQPATSHYNTGFSQMNFEVVFVRLPQILSVSNLPNNIFYNTGSKYLQGILKDEGVYNLKLHILEDDILCEKTLRLTCYNPNNKYIYKVNYPINIGFIKYNPLERLGISTLSDGDARRYFNRTNISNTSIQNKISNFVSGLKNLNVWNKFQNIWILKSGYNSNDSSFYDLKNIDFSGSIIGGMTKSISGYKITTNSFDPVSSRLSLANYPIKFNGNWTTMFLLENYTGSLPTTAQAFLSNDSYQASGFRMGYAANNKEFNFWNGESLPPGSGGFGLTETNSHLTKYSFITASLSTGTLGYVYSGTAKLLVDNKSKIQSSAPYKISNKAIQNLSSPAGGNYGFENNIAFFGLSDQDLSNYHSGIRDLARNTIYDNLNF